MSLFEKLTLLIWAVAYFISIIIAAEKYENEKHDKNIIISIFWRILPYGLSLVFCYRYAIGKGIFQFLLFSAIFLVITWVIIFTTRIEWRR